MSLGHIWWDALDLHGLSIDDNLEAMSQRDRDPGADVLLDLDGQVFVVDAKGGYPAVVQRHIALDEVLFRKSFRGCE